MNDENDPLRRLIDRHVPWANQTSDLFSEQAFGTQAPASKGWKLHVSASALSAVEVLRVVLNILLNAGVRFKVVKSLALLNLLNSGQFGISQIGKFVTVYPSDDLQAVSLAAQLHEATRGFRGPRIPTDRPLTPGSLVHYRYGAMYPQRESGDITEEAVAPYDMVDEGGRLTQDVRASFYNPPQLISDPFEAAGLFVPKPHREQFIRGRYLICDALSSGLQGGVFRAIDIGSHPARFCVLKETWHDVGIDGSADLWSENEAKILRHHADNPLLPRLFERFVLDGDRYNVIEYYEGVTLDRVVQDRQLASAGMDPTELVEVGLETAAILGSLHDSGLIFRDFKPQNILRTRDGSYRLIDFGISYDTHDSCSQVVVGGTPAFCSPEQVAGDQPTPEDDVFSWGAVLHLLACGTISISQLTNDRPLALSTMKRKSVALLRPDFPKPIAAVIDRATSWEPNRRYPTMGEASSALRGASNSLPFWSETHAPNSSRDSRPRVDDAALVPMSQDELSLKACGVGDELLAAAIESGGGLCWKTMHEMDRQGQLSPDLYSGAAGIGLFLAELARSTGKSQYAAGARGAARWLCGPTWARGRAQHGLHCGEPGIAFFLVRIAEILDEPGYITAAELRMARLKGVSPLTSDLTHGAAGTILSLLRLHAVTNESVFLKEACHLGDQLIGTAIADHGTQGGGCYWEMASNEGIATKPYLGLLHGTAGVGLALAQLGGATGREKYMAMGKDAAKLLLRLARSQPSSVGTSLHWSRELGDIGDSLQAHCHGAGGIGQFFLRLNQLAPEGEYLRAAAGAADTISQHLDSEEVLGLCHGLSGSGQMLLDCFRALGDPYWRTRALFAAQRLDVLRTKQQPEASKETHDVAISPDLMLGSAGVGSLFLRLSQAKTAGDLILG